MRYQFENIPGIKSGTQAMKACGMQPEFAAQLMLMQQSAQTSLILRAGSPPVYDRPRSPKTGLNLSKTSNQGFFKGAIAENVMFTRLQKGQDNALYPIGHHYKDTHRLEEEVNVRKIQNTVQLPIRLKDMIKEMRDNGDLEISKYDPQNGEVRFKYKQGKGPSDFKGEFVIKTQEGTPFTAHESREWDRIENDPEFDKQKGIVKNPTQGKMTDSDWENFYKATIDKEYPLYYTTQANSQRLEKAEVFANDKGLIVAGDWDGLALGHPPNLPEYAKKVYNTFDRDPLQILMLITETRKLITDIKKNIANKEKNGQPLTGYEAAMKKVSFEAIHNEFATQRAGCVTPYEFLNNCVANHLYKQENETTMRNKMVGLVEGYEKGIDIGRTLIQQGMPLATVINQAQKAAKETVIEQQIQSYQKKNPSIKLSENDINKIRQSVENSVTNIKLFDHLKTSVAQVLTQDFPNKNAINNPIPKITHPDYDPNIADLFQHGFDMRNPYGSNLEGAWAMVTDEGMFLYGENQKQLIDVMLSPNFLENNQIDVNFAADMSAGWDKVIQRQIALGQNVPQATKDALNVYKEMQALQSQNKLSPKQLDKTNEFIQTFPKHNQTIPAPLMGAVLNDLNSKAQNGTLKDADLQRINMLAEHKKEFKVELPTQLQKYVIPKIDAHHDAVPVKLLGKLESLLKKEGEKEKPVPQNLSSTPSPLVYQQSQVQKENQKPKSPESAIERTRTRRGGISGPS